MTYKILFAVTLVLASLGEAAIAGEARDRQDMVSRAAAIEAAFNIVQRRDAEALLRHIDDDALTGHGMESGKDYFISRYRPEDPASPVWDDLITILAVARGEVATSDRKNNCFPARVMEIEDSNIAFPIGSATGVWSEPSVKATLVTRVGSDATFTLGEQVDREWHQVTVLGADQSGYVRRSDVRFATDRFLCIRVDGESWMVTDYIYYE